MRTYDELERLWQGGPPSPARRGRVRLIVARLGDGAHDTPEAARLDVDEGLVGDRWAAGTRRRVDHQITLMDARVAELVRAEDQPRHAPGDNLLVDLDLSEAALPVGTTVQAGTALLEITAAPHLGCRKFAARFGDEAHRWVNDVPLRHRRLRGVNARILESGEVRIGDPVLVLG